MEFTFSININYNMFSTIL